jgi:hypothetical protein
MTILTKFSNNQTLFTICSCQNEILVVDYDHELGTADLSIYEQYSSYSFKMSWKQRIRYIWHILTQGKVYGDQIVLNKKQLKELNQFINRCI